ncbi:TPA: hypothetical protein N0F65_011965 [Lagenidium giganteum]|uniref:Uncharacterized protein n=1 Tax=Lagenidium giganteum TaxID=4803 RepID=A0AAV2Z5E4_9STRA|nr:TPA: hypothetical protein N0F65_011965 [Lagenidium giganteum]
MTLVCAAVANLLEGWHELPMGSFRNPPSSYHRVLMLQRLCTVTALLAAAAAVGDAVNVHIKVHHPRAATNATTATNATATNATATTSGGGSAAGNSSAWHMKPVMSIQARVQGDTPLWDATKKAYVSSYSKTFDAQYRGVLDTVNTASVEGALMYVQAEGINKREQSVECERKNKMTNIVFYEITMVQPTPAIAYYNGKHSTPEYCPFVAMDGGKCTEAGSDIPDTCKQFDGLDGLAKVGHCVGANEQTTGSGSGSVDGSGTGKNTVDGKAPVPSSAITSALLSTAAVAFSAVAAALL